MDKNGIIVLYNSEYGNIEIEYIKFKAHGNSVSFVITNGKVIIFCYKRKNYSLLGIN